ncbi:hypothetical protein F5Y19DRAFT_431652 [Xylariaceae sp. FL1651]|nr:hypothetical protein F5Y19DRAFT_431652 [Xylariaceae sp. FL1651]
MSWSRELLYQSLVFFDLDMSVANPTALCIFMSLAIPWHWNFKCGLELNYSLGHPLQMTSLIVLDDQNVNMYATSPIGCEKKICSEFLGFLSTVSDADPSINQNIEETVFPSPKS